MATVVAAFEPKPALRSIGNGELLQALYRQKKAKKPLVLFCTKPRNIGSKEDREFIKNEVRRILDFCEPSPRFTVVFAEPIRARGEETLYVVRARSGEVKFFSS